MSQQPNIEIVKSLEPYPNALASYMASLVTVQPVVPSTEKAKAEKVVMTEAEAIALVTAYSASLPTERKKALAVLLSYLFQVQKEGKTTVLAGKGKENKKPMDCTTNTIETLCLVASEGANLYGGYYMSGTKKVITNLSKMGRLDKALAFPSAVLKLKKSLGVK